MKDKKQSKEGVFTYIKNQNATVWIILLAIVGLILLILPEKEDLSSKSDYTSRLYEYETKTEMKIGELCSNIRGVSSVKVSVYFDSGFESVYAFNEESKATSNGLNSEKKYVTVGSGNDESMVCLFERMPNISGVAIVCKGGSNPIVANEIINMIASAFDVPKNKIYVTEGKN